jgi:hypothetical protein
MVPMKTPSPHRNHRTSNRKGTKSSGSLSSKSSRKRNRRSSSTSSNSPQAGSLLSMNNISHAIATHVTRSSRKALFTEESTASDHNGSPGKIEKCMQDIVGVQLDVLKHGLDVKQYVVSVPEARITKAGHVEYHICLDVVDEANVSRWLRYSVIRQKAKECTDADMSNFPPKTFFSSTRPEIVRSRRADLTAWITRTLDDTKDGMKWLLQLLYASD